MCCAFLFLNLTIIEVKAAPITFVIPRDDISVSSHCDRVQYARIHFGISVCSYVDVSRDLSDHYLSISVIVMILTSFYDYYIVARNLLGSFRVAR